MIESLWKPALVTQEPTTQLTQWQAYEVKNLDGIGWDLHFMGHTGYEGRVCSAVQEFDRSTMSGITRSGRIYKLIGLPGHNSDAEYVWGNWLRMYGDPETRCVSDILLLTDEL